MLGMLTWTLTPIQMMVALRRGTMLGLWHQVSVARTSRICARFALSTGCYHCTQHLVC